MTDREQRLATALALIILIVENPARMHPFFERIRKLAQDALDAEPA